MYYIRAMLMWVFFSVFSLGFFIFKQPLLLSRLIVASPPLTAMHSFSFTLGRTQNSIYYPHCYHRPFIFYICITLHISYIIHRVYVVCTFVMLYFSINIHYWRALLIIVQILEGVYEVCTFDMFIFL